MDIGVAVRPSALPDSTTAAIASAYHQPMEEAHKPPSGWGAVWRQALAVAIGGIAAGAVIVPGATLWNELNEPDISGLADDVQSSLQRSLRADETYGEYNLTVQHLALVETGKNTYTGMATVKPQRGSADDVKVTVIYDGDNMMWNTERGALAWLANN